MATPAQAEAAQPRNGCAATQLCAIERMVTMQIPLEIRYHQVDGSDALDSEIRRHADRLDKLYDRLIACRVSVEAPHRQHRTGNVLSIHIELSVPGSSLVVSHEPHKAQERQAHPNIHTALRVAFKAAERQLKAFKEVQRGEVKPHDVPFQGTVAGLVPDEDYGFILTDTGREIYFSRTSVLGTGFEALAVGDTVHYAAADGDGGPVASKVWKGPAHHMD
jgi:cold shock CspA family protein/ribosome-associated translation inhibitor RaiA